MIEQRTRAWFDQRAGKLTGSQFAAALGLNPYKSRQKLWREMTNRAEPESGNAFTTWGTENEANAIDWYECVSGNIVRPVGFVVHPKYEFLGLSPDGLVGQDGSIEAKCPASLRLYGCIPDYYLPQVLGCIHITGRQWCDFICWTPSEAQIIRVERNEKQWTEWESQLIEFYEKHVLADVEPPRKKRSKANGV